MGRVERDDLERTREGGFRLLYVMRFSGEGDALPVISADWETDEC